MPCDDSFYSKLAVLFIANCTALRKAASGTAIKRVPNATYSALSMSAQVPTARSHFRINQGWSLSWMCRIAFDAGRIVICPYGFVLARVLGRVSAKNSARWLLAGAPGGEPGNGAIQSAVEIAGAQSLPAALLPANRRIRPVTLSNDRASRSREAHGRDVNGLLKPETRLCCSL
jgi:hypothetical protein